MKKIIFGTGPTYGKYKSYLNNIEYFIDNDPHKHYTLTEGKTIYPFDKIYQEDEQCEIIIAISNVNNIKSQLNMIKDKKNIIIKSILDYVTLATNEPKISILIPTFNREAIIEETLDSAINQNYNNFEIIVSDNNSEDNTFSIIKEKASKFNNIRINQNTENLGAFKNWYECVKLANGEYSKILFSDDLIGKNYLKKTAPYLLEEDIGFVTTIVSGGKESKNEWIHGALFEYSGLFERKDFYKKVFFGESDQKLVSPGAALFRTKDLKSVMEEILNNKDYYHYLEKASGIDLLIYLLVSTKYPKVGFVNEKLAYFRVHDDSLSTIDGENDKLFQYDYLNIRKEFIMNNMLLEELLI